MKKPKTKSSWRLYPVPYQHSTTVLYGLNQTGKRISWDKRRRDQWKLPITYTDNHKGLGPFKCLFFLVEIWWLWMKKTQPPKHYALSSTNSLLNIIALHFNSLYLLDFLHGLDPFHILSLVVTKNGNRIVYTAKICFICIFLSVIIFWGQNTVE